MLREGVLGLVLEFCSVRGTNVLQLGVDRWGVRREPGNLRVGVMWRGVQRRRVPGRILEGR